MSAALMGSGIGLALGAIYLTAGMAGHATDHARAEGIAVAAAQGYLQSPLPPAHAAKPMLAPPASTEKPARRRADIECLTEAVYYEARGESARGQAAVAQVVLNRVKHPAFPKTVCGVVFQGCQFSFACDGSMRSRREGLAWNRARNVALRALSGAALAEVGSATHFHTTGVSPAWGPKMAQVAKVGMHVFYKLTPRLRSREDRAPELMPEPTTMETAILVSAPAAEVPELRVIPALNAAALPEPATPKAPSTPVSKPSEAAALAPADAAAGGAS